MEEFLKPTELVDLDSEVVVETTNRVIKDAKTPIEAAIKIFYFVRDEIKFGFVLPQEKASSVIKKKMGQCTAKTSLTVAMLRASNIPARFHFTYLKPESVKGLVDPRTYGFVSKRMGRIEHAYPAITSLF